jgi:hypothetical protein
MTKLAEAKDLGTETIKKPGQPYPKIFKYSILNKLL